MTTSSHIPEGFQSVTPLLVVNGATTAIEFYRRAFGATEIMRLVGPDGQILHAEIEIDGTMVMVADEFPEFSRSPQSLGGTPVFLHLYVEDVDALARRAIDAGAELLIPVDDQFYGDRSGRLLDPFGHVWIIASHTEDVSPEEMQRRADELF